MLMLDYLNKSWDPTYAQLVHCRRSVNFLMPVLMFMLVLLLCLLMFL